ncbi:prolyl endopeptidase-like [Venturia canescens]|uniref:prolyl endopeptidase-like n=1 Tax=Venturia canescens TaxID=32260 RepID=UPI001C9D2362|nr:prolyl endopeptidase-like [Venturia canescens]
MDMLRYDKFTIGYAWVSEYDSPDDPRQFENLLKYSPLHNVKAPSKGVQFPATLLLTVDHDDRDVPLHSFKLAATLQHDIGRLPDQSNPIMIKIEIDAGHGGEQPAIQLEIEEDTGRVDAAKQDEIIINYPLADRFEFTINDYFGQKIPDPYAWLEHPDSDEVKQFINKQNAVTTAYLSGGLIRQKIKDELTKLCDFRTYSCPKKHGNKYYYNIDSGLQSQSVLHVQDSLNSEPRVFLDPKICCANEVVSITDKVFSDNGEILAFSASVNGSDWNEIYFKNTETGFMYPEVLKRVKYSTIMWTKDNKGIFYGAYPEENEVLENKDIRKVENQKLYYHIVGTEQSKDVLVVEFPDEPYFRIKAQVVDYNGLLLIFAMNDTDNTRMYLTRLPVGKISQKFHLEKIIDEPQSTYEYVTNDGPMAFFVTNKNAPNFQLIRIDLEHPKTAASIVLPQHAINVLSWVRAVDKDKLVTCYIENVKSVLQLYSLNTGRLLRTFPLEVGTIAEFSGDKKNSEIFYRFTSFLTPGIIYRVDLREDKAPEIFKTMGNDNLDLREYETKQVFYKSKDGTRIPMFIVAKADSVKDGTMPAILHGYGGFGVSVQPFFSAKTLLFVKHFNGVFAVANIRGGGEYGEEWHEAGKLFKKQNTFDDFQSAAEYLVQNGFTSPSMLTIEGESNGGLLVAACINQRPELFGAAIANVGVMDMLKYHNFTIGYAWVPEYGSSDNRKEFINLLKYSPLHNVKRPPKGVQFPATLLLTADHDDRVVPLHSLKHIATLQYHIGRSPFQRNPILARIEKQAGHGSGKSLTKQIEEAADSMTFIVKALNLQHRRRRTKNNQKC